MSSYLENLRKTIEDRLTETLGVPVSVRMTKDPVHGNYTTNIVSALAHVRGPATDLLSACVEKLLDLPVARLEYAAPVFLNFYLEEGWQHEALRQILQNGDATILPMDTLQFGDFEIQYAYNRICNQLELLTSLGYAVPDVDKARLDLLTTDEELRLMEQLAATPDLAQISKCFHQFFNTSPIRGETWEIAGARMALVQACKLVFESVLKESFPNT